MIWFVALLGFGAVVSLAALFLASKKTAYTSGIILAAFFISAFGQKLFDTLQPWEWFIGVDFALIVTLFAVGYRKQERVVASLAFISILTSTLYGLGVMAGRYYTAEANFFYGSILNGLVYLEFFAVIWGIWDDRRRTRDLERSRRDYINSLAVKSGLRRSVDHPENVA